MSQVENHSNQKKKKSPHLGEYCIHVLMPLGLKNAFFRELETHFTLSPTGFMKDALFLFSSDQEASKHFPSVQVKDFDSYSMLSPHFEARINPEESSSERIVFTADLNHGNSLDFMTSDNEKLQEQLYARLNLYAQTFSDYKLKQRYDYLNRYRKDKYDRTKVWIPKEERDRLVEIASKNGLSLSRYTLYATVKIMENDYGYISVLRDLFEDNSDNTAK